MQFSHYTWDLYKQSESGKDTIASFEYHSVFWNDIDFIKKYHPYLAQITPEREYKSFMQEFGEIAYFQRQFEFSEFSQVREAYEYYLENGVFYEYDDERTYVADPQDYQFFLENHTMVSFFFFGIAYKFCFPNLFVFRFFDLNKIADFFGIILPPIPKKSDYKARCLYYMDLCEVFYNFRIKNNLSPDELCAFLYDFAPNFIETETQEMPQPTQAWFIGGKIQNGDTLAEDMLWQCNPETQKGDILVHYQTSPVSAITHIWKAKTYGVKDPFFYYYANSYLTQGVEILGV